MYDNICSLPLTSDLIALTIHPTAPILSVGLSAGHVQTYRLPSGSEPAPLSPQTKPSNYVNGSSTHNHSDSSPSKKPALRHSSRESRSPSLNGFGTIDTIWRTRRHKGSCRDLSFSIDGASLYSTGTDGLVKAASSETGKVFCKIAAPTIIAQEDGTPSLVTAISPQALLLATDGGAVHLYDLRDSSVTSTPQRTLHPHRTADDPKFAEPITSLTPLPPSEASTSSTSRQFVTTAGSTVAACDLRKGVLGASVDQGDVVSSSTCLVTSTSATPKRKHDGSISSKEKVLVGGSSGSITLWERGQYDDRVGSIVVHSSPRLPAGDDDDGSIDCIAPLPKNSRANNNRQGQSHIVAAGVGTGAVRFVEVRGKGGSVLGEVRHDEMGVEGVSALGFDVIGRMISAGGEIVKVWHEIGEGEEAGDAWEDEDSSDDGQDEDDDDAVGDSDDEAMMDSGGEEENQEAEEASSDSDDAPKRKKRRKKGKGRNSDGGHHGITGIRGLV